MHELTLAEEYEKIQAIKKMYAEQNSPIKVETPDQENNGNKIKKQDQIIQLIPKSEILPKS